AALPQKVSQGDKIGGTSAKGTHMRRQVGRMVSRRRRGIFGRHRHPVGLRVDVNTSGVWGGQAQPVGRSRSTRFFRILRATGRHGDLQNGTCVPKGGTSAGGRDRETISQTGTRVCAPPMMSPRTPGTMLTAGHKAPLS